MNEGTSRDEFSFIANLLNSRDAWTDKYILNTRQK
jgi:hypothetical protein